MRVAGRSVSLLMAAVLALVPLIAGAAAEGDMGPLSVKDGMLQPVFTYTDALTPDYTNAGSDILRFCVWVETDYDQPAGPASGGRSRRVTAVPPPPAQSGANSINQNHRLSRWYAPCLQGILPAHV